MFKKSACLSLSSLSSSLLLFSCIGSRIIHYPKYRQSKLKINSEYRQSQHFRIGLRHGISNSKHNNHKRDAVSRAKPDCMKYKLTDVDDEEEVKMREKRGPR